MFNRFSCLSIGAFEGGILVDDQLDLLSYSHRAMVAQEIKGGAVGGRVEAVNVDFSSDQHEQEDR